VKHGVKYGVKYAVKCVKFDMKSGGVCEKVAAATWKFLCEDLMGQQCPPVCAVCRM
jgi:hypothetical protein